MSLGHEESIAGLHIFGMATPSLYGILMEVGLLIWCSGRYVVAVVGAGV